ncbi:DM13 domain-containing protein [Aliisedimentitalea scapharcae]|uniref:DM13 domain-containing protein n=1 Tax=Aliisedimentitalea scapharcae TaxID=1524259 RepID=A0ABZ2XWI1_9RHOB
MINRRNFLSVAVASGAALIISGPQAFAAEGGHFEGRSKHITTGKVKIVKKDGGYVVELGNDFSLDGAPDPRVGLGKNGKYDPATDLGELRNLKGGQSYAVPAGVDISGHNEVYIWCRKFNVPLGVATLN